MATTVRIRKNFAPLAQTEFITAEDMRDLGQELIGRIKARTARGVDANGVPFARYSPGYAEQKGAYAFGALASVLGVNLQLTGAMLGAMAVIEATPKTVVIGFVR